MKSSFSFSGLKRLKEKKVVRIPTEQELKDYREIFNLVDNDGNGDIDQEELELLMRLLGITPKKNEIKKMMEEMELEPNGLISFEHFVLVMSKNPQSEMFTEKDLKNAFKTFETEGRAGYVSSKIMEHAFQTYGDQVCDVVETETFIRMLDPKRDGEFNYIDLINAREGMI